MKFVPAHQTPVPPKSTKDLNRKLSHSVVLPGLNFQRLNFYWCFGLEHRKWNHL